MFETGFYWEGMGVRVVRLHPDTYVSPRITLFLHVIQMNCGNELIYMLKKIFFADYASCNGFIERCSQPLSQRSLNIYFRLNQVQ